MNLRSFNSNTIGVGFPKPTSSTALRRALLALALGTLVPAAAHAQIFVANYGGTVGEYNLDGSTVNASLISGLGTTYAVALSGSNLFVSNAAGTIGMYNLDGTTVNASWVSGLSGGSHQATGMAFSGSSLYISEENAGTPTIAQYNASNGAFVTSVSTSSGLATPIGLAVSGSNLYVANNGSSWVGQLSISPSLSATVTQPYNNSASGQYGAAVVGKYLFISNASGGTVSEYDTSSSSVYAKATLSGFGYPAGLAAAGSDLFVANYTSHSIGEYQINADGSVTTVNAALITGLSGPIDIAVMAIPEPGTYAAWLGVAALGFCLIRRTRAGRAECLI